MAQTTDALRLTNARLFLGELMALAAAPSVTSGGKGRSPGNLNELIRIVMGDIQTLEALTGVSGQRRGTIKVDMRGR